MRPALDRLLARPESLRVLRFLVGWPGKENIHQRTTARRGLASNGASRRHLTIRTVAVSPRNNEEAGNMECWSRSRSLVPKPAELSTASVQLSAQSDSTAGETPSTYLDYGHWGRLIASRLDFESDLGSEWASTTKLLHDRHNRKDGRLWARLLNYRQRIYGDIGVLEFWEGVQVRNLWIPCRGRYADFCWQTIVKVVLKDERMLWNLCEYANNMFDSTGNRWRSLYATIILHLLRDNQRTQAIRLHELLISRHPPTPGEFSRLCRQVIIWNGDLEGLRRIYLGNTHRNVYRKIVPTLCAREDFQAAYGWHTFLLKNQDRPTDPNVVEPLLRFLTIYDPSKAAAVTNSLRQSDIPIGFQVIETQEDTLPLSREMMNVIHGKTFNISVKNYNDDLGARWFATKWISLDLAINAVHSLGVQEIGPLSLQAIALREVDAVSIVARIDQLKVLGIGLGSSLFCRAAEKFARQQQHILLDGLLKSDQHPSEYDNVELQETLLASYERTRNWHQYNLTLAIIQLGSKSTEIARENLMLRSAIANGHSPSILERLAKMQDEGTVVTRKTLAYLIRNVLDPRQSGRLPMRLKKLDVKRLATILQSLMKTGTYVPPTFWREIIRRLGMLGQFTELERVCLFIASWYGGFQGTFSSNLLSPSPRYRIPDQISNNHALHPLRILFPDSLQKAIVEWGFIHSMASLVKIDSRPQTADDRPIPQVAKGIYLLNALREKGIHINQNAVKQAVDNRFLIYYGPGSSQRAYNRHARAKNPLTIEEMAGQVDAALGESVFTRTDLQQAIQERALRTARKVQRRKQRDMERSVDSGAQL